MKVNNAVAVVTGANRGVGRALVEALLAYGAARVYATGRNFDGLASTVALDPQRVRALQLDVTPLPMRLHYPRVAAREAVAVAERVEDRREPEQAPENSSRGWWNWLPLTDSRLSRSSRRGRVTA